MCSCPNDADLTQIIASVMVSYHMREIDRLHNILDALGQSTVFPKTLEDFLPHAENRDMAIHDYTCYLLNELESYSSASANS